MSIVTDKDIDAIRQISEIVGITLKRMREHTAVGMNTRDLDAFGEEVLRSFGARSAPKLAYGFPGATCISVNEVIAHGVPTSNRVLKEGDLVNIDVSAELNGLWADNGGSFVLGEDIHGHQPLVDTSKRILEGVLGKIKHGAKMALTGKFVEQEAKKAGFKVIRNLCGHGVGRSLHEEPREIPNCYDPFNRRRFKRNYIVAIETFIATHSQMATQLADGWTLVGNKGGFVAQHEHTIIVTDEEPIILTGANGIFD